MNSDCEQSNSGPKSGKRPTDCQNHNGRNLKNYASPCTASKMSARNYHVTHHITVGTVTVTAPVTTKGRLLHSVSVDLEVHNHCDLFEMWSHSYTSKTVTS